MKQFRKEFSIKSFSFPLKSQGSASYYQTLSKGLELFENKIAKLSTDKEINNRIIAELENIKMTNKILLSVISSYLLGNSGDAYKILENVLENDFWQDRIAKLIEKDVSFTNSESHLIRIRASKDQISNREEMFHIPFSKRHLVANQRFSIAGLPCLYLGSSIYVCWLELGRKDFGELWIAGFQTQTKFKILNLAYDLNIIMNLYDQSKIDLEQFVNYFLLWPLVMTCSFQVKYSGAPFHEEYIIPSLLLQWITFKNKNIVGLKYLSTKLENYENPAFGVNYVFPPRTVTDEYEFCPQLQSRFKLTNPLSWELMSILPPVDVSVCGTGINAENIEEALLKNYHISRFGYIENQSFSMNFDFIKNPKNPKVTNSL